MRTVTNIYRPQLPGTMTSENFSETSDHNDSIKPVSDTAKEETESTPVPSDGRPPFSLAREAIFVATLVFAQLLTQAGIGQSLAPLHIIGNHFNVTNEGELSWYLASYALTTGTLILMAGRLGDMFGNKNVFIAGYMWFGVWSIIAGASYWTSTDKFFVVCRAMQGIGASFLLPNALAILGRTYPQGMRKNMVFSLFGSFAPTGYILGTVFSSILSRFATWAWAYFIMGFVSLAMAGASIWTIPWPEKTPAPGRRESFDWYGCLTGVTGLVLFNIAWNQGPNVGWDTPYVYVLLILGTLSLIAFVFVEKRAKHPLLPVSALNLHIGLILGAVFAGWSSFGIWLYYIWQYLENVRGLSPVLVAAQNSPSSVGGFLASVSVGLMMGKVGVPYIMLMAMCAFCLASILVATMTVGQTYWGETFISTLVVPWGLDMSFPAATIMLSMSVPKEHQGIAASMVLTTTNYAISIGLGIAGTVVSQLDQSSDLATTCKHAWYVSIGLSGLGILIALVAAWHDRKTPKAAPH
ncbi:Drug resistance protein [Lachnellula suecica]|uniref:Drug resistance protein n=1 Tax=Lachnellula suecica TaxID=602035 RepID=A0A8T9CFS6_9HELO|nr:Drug resistance protein [Lachnellula suecica]